MGLACLNQPIGWQGKETSYSILSTNHALSLYAEGVWQGSLVSGNRAQGQVGREVILAGVGAVYQVEPYLKSHTCNSRCL